MNKRKIIVLSLNILLAMLVITTSVFAWLSNDGLPGDKEGDYERDVFLSSSGLFDAFIEVTLPGSTLPINISSEQFQRNGDLSIRLPLNSSTPVVTENGKRVTKFSISIFIKAANDINLRVNLLEKWLTTSTTIANKNLFDVIYEPSFNKRPNGEYMYYDKTIKKSNEYIEIPFVKHLELKQGLNNFSGETNTNVSFIVMLNAIQENRNSIWNSDERYFKEEISFSNSYNLNNFVVDTSALTTTNATIRNTALIFRRYHDDGLIISEEGNYDEYVFSNHKRSNKDNLTIPAGIYELIIFDINQIRINIDRLNNPTSIEYDYFYDSDSWGLEDYLYGPNPIPTWQKTTTGNIGDNLLDLTYYGGNFYRRTNKTTVSTPPPGGNWRLFTVNYQQHIYANSGEIIFYDNGYWMNSGYAGENVPPKLTGEHDAAWRPLGKRFRINNASDYNQNSLTYLNLAGVPNWYYATSRGDLGQLTKSSGWKLITFNFNNTINSSNQKYRQNEIIYHQNNYYIVTPQGESVYNISTPSANNSHYIQARNRGEYNSITNYTQGDLVTKDGYLYLWRRNIAYNNNVPGLDKGWFRLSKDDGSEQFEWFELNDYVYNENLKEPTRYRDRLYIWKGINFSNSTNPPGTSREGWEEVTENFSPFNNYYLNDYVIHDGELWRAMENIPVDPITGANILPRGINSLRYWEQVSHFFNPGRNY